MIKLIIADDHPLYRAALVQTLPQAFEGEDTQLFEAQSVAEVHHLLESEEDIDLIILDLHMPGAQGFSGLINLRGCYPDIPVVMVSGNDGVDVRSKAASYGAAGFISKSCETRQLLEAMQTLLAGQHWFGDLPEAAIDQSSDDLAQRVASLTPHQFRVFVMIAQGLLNKQIAYHLGISEPTVKSHVTAIFKKLGVRKRTEVIIVANALSETVEDLNQQLLDD
ncbi:response regulator [Pseudoteredinibacter isoporae]|uniref:DNA-binding NarL/FixJ family response regulator n=1 Tax=Pseudoteredinibacter isoporae TaxID=570281 RepID=A0A7X0MW90_9GAMM|nr:response regulator transcription factor [Pseudoteredinibacter isoporae]MBB6522481.1 DNA-binding NarL/FixJ family response regulator [Pseudoteredinibacter isoporae]NHO88011.1 response regulator transcription factor [Pseudoteredinibacter isoporae]NIB23658.1 response regulator transcription factor [Pseudoteredinibacter isoporae]